MSIWEVVDTTYRYKSNNRNSFWLNLDWLELVLQWLPNYRR